jgi:hypothetical protein
MNKAPLGTLTRVDLRHIWENEATEFTPWLAQPANLAIVADTIGVDLECEAQERTVGPFRADILCKEVGVEDHWVLIENQLDRTDHGHLGQLLTYAAGLQTVTIVWIAAKFTEEHRAALDWLNEITDTRFKFFGLEVELWRIGDSPAAPRFNVISKPNDWTKSISRAARGLGDESVSETKAQQFRYWQGLKELLESARSTIRCRAPRPQHWTTFSIGRSGFHLAATVNTVENRIGAELFIRGEDAKAYFAQLREHKDEIERVAGAALDWQELPERIGSRIALYKEDVDPTEEADWPNQHRWLADALQSLDRALRNPVRNLDLSESHEQAEVVG